MNARGSTCVMCGDQLAEPYGGFTLPSVCVQLMAGGDDVDPSTIAGSVSVDFCEECTAVARRMIREYDTSPLPEFDVDAVSWQSAELASALIGGDVSADAVAGDAVDRRTIADAATTVKAHRDGAADHILEGKIDRAYVVLMASRELGILEGDLAGGL